MNRDLRPPDGHYPAGHGDGREHERLADAIPTVPIPTMHGCEFRFATRPGALRRAAVLKRNVRRTQRPDFDRPDSETVHPEPDPGPRIARASLGAARISGAARPRLIILNVMLLAVGIAAWRAGYLAAFELLGWQESLLLALLGAYTAVGFGAAWCGRWDTVRRVANALPAWGLAFTGVGLLLAAAGLHSLTPAALSAVFRSLVFAVAPNIVGVLGFAWLTMLANWAAGQDT